MFTLAFVSISSSCAGWVKASETAGNVDTTTWSGYLKMSLFLNAVRLGGLAVMLRDSLGLGTSKTLTF
jgi:hypothetical protein